MSGYKKQSIGRQKATALFKSNWWIGRPARDLAKFQLFTEELCMPFSVFHEAIETAIGRPVLRHEIVMNYDAIVQELLGERDAPTLAEIIGLIPENKTFPIIV